MYEVMARRYRPATFDEVVGQEHIAATLKNAIARDRVAHAYIFTGGHGCGKTTMARILAKALDCVDGPTPEPCCRCHICLDIAAGRDADVMEIDGASNNGIEQIRQLRELAAYVPSRARFKIYIIDEVHMLSDGAFNALLKTLEEPPKHVKFVLATTDPHKVPDTILSRCQRFDFRLVPAPKLAAFFKRLANEEKAAISDDALDAVASFAEGSVRDGLVLLDQLLSFADGEVSRQDVETVRGVAAAENVAGIFEAIAASDVRKALTIVDEVASRGTSVGDFLDQLITFGRDLMLFAATSSADGAVSYGPAREALLRLGKATSLESALLWLDVLVQARTRVRSRSLTNPLVALEMAVARLAGLGGVTPVAEILKGLAGLPAIAPAPAASLPAAKPAAAPAAVAPSRAKEKETLAQPESAETRPVPQKETGAAFASPAGSKPGSEIPAETNGESDDVCLEHCLTPLTLDSVKRVWQKITEKLGLANVADSRYLGKLAVAAVRDDVVTLAGTQLAVEAYEDGRRLARLTEAAAEILARPVMFSFVAETAKAEPERGGGKEDAVRARLVRHPAVEQIRDIFDGAVVDVRCAGTAPDSDAGPAAIDDASEEEAL